MKKIYFGTEKKNKGIQQFFNKLEEKNIKYRIGFLLQDTEAKELVIVVTDLDSEKKLYMSK